MCPLQACDAIAQSLDLRGQRERALTFSLRRAAWQMRRDESEVLGHAAA